MSTASNMINLSRAFYGFIETGNLSLRKVIIDAKDARWACYFCESVSNDADMRQVILDAKDPKWAVYYCAHVSDDADMRQIVLDAKNFDFLLDYCRQVKVVDKGDLNNEVLKAAINMAVDQNSPEYVLRVCSDAMVTPELYELLLATNNPKWAYEYCHKVKDDAQMRQVIVNSQNAYFAAMYCLNIGFDAQLSAIVIQSGDPKAAFHLYFALKHQRILGKHKELRSQIRQVILESGNPKWALEYCNQISDDADMRQMIVDSGDLECMSDIIGG